MSKRDFYDILGVKKGASDDELKKAYRKAAMQHHPDRNPNDKKSEQLFKEANEAYDTLKDPQKRAAYDRFGHSAFEQGGGGNRGGGAGFAGGGFGGGAGGFQGADFGDLFGDFFADVFGQQSAGGPARGADLRYNLTIGLEEAFHGKTVQIKIPTTAACHLCHGSGAKPGSQPRACGTCGGAGQVRITQGFFSMQRTCPQCHGRGTVITDPCTTCHGHGIVKKEKTLSVNIPKGVDDGMRIRLAGEGETGPNGGGTGDLYIFVQIKPHTLFQREGQHLHLDIPISLTQATLGDVVEIPTPDGGKLKLTIPEGTQPDTQFRLKGKGMPIVNQSGHGDLFVHATVHVPTKLSKKQKELLAAFAAESPTPSAWETFMDKAERFWKK
jgi:molecular chaperone DnaJ